MVRAVLQHVGDPGIVAELFQAVRRLLDGSAEGKLRGIHDRSGLVNAVAALSSAPHAPAGLPTDTCEFLCGFYRSGSDPAGPAAALLCMTGT